MMKSARCSLFSFFESAANNYTNYVCCAARSRTFRRSIKSAECAVVGNSLLYGGEGMGEGISFTKRSNSGPLNSYIRTYMCSAYKIRSSFVQLTTMDTAAVVVVAAAAAAHARAERAKYPLKLGRARTTM